MSISINYKNTSTINRSSSLILFTDEKFNVAKLKKYISASEYLAILDLIKSRDLKEKIQIFEISSKKK